MGPSGRAGRATRTGVTYGAPGSRPARTRAERRTHRTRAPARRPHPQTAPADRTRRPDPYPQAPLTGPYDPEYRHRARPRDRHRAAGAGGVDDRAVAQVHRHMARVGVVDDEVA